MPSEVGSPVGQQRPLSQPELLTKPGETTSSTAPKHRARWQRVTVLVTSLLLVYLVVAYVLLPLRWSRYAHRHPSLDAIPRITRTRADIPGDPLNVALVGSETELLSIMLSAKWYPADPLTLRSCLKIAGAAIFARAYDAAPVSNLYYGGRKEDLAFEQPVGRSPRHRHHVRFWRLDRVKDGDRPVWVGSAVYDERVGLSRTTGQVTHVTAPDVDAERDYLFHDLERTGDLAEQYVVDGFHQQREGRNGGGDPWHTDGKLYVGILAARNSP